MQDLSRPDSISSARLRVLVIWPPHVPSYFNAGHHLGLFEVGAYLRQMREVAEVKCVDAGALNLTWKHVGDLLFEQFDVIAIMNEFDALEGFGRIVRYARALSPGTRIVTFGRLSSQVPGLFERYDIDAIVHSGDYEAGVEAFVRRVAGTPGDLPGVAVQEGGAWVQPTQPGVFLDPQTWVLPDIREIPYDAYMRLYLSDQNKFCGIPERLELVLPVARGCPLQCEYCDVPAREGLRERRLPVDRAVRYIEDSFAAAPFEYIAMYAPTFTLNKKWVHQLCEQLTARGSRYPWKCTTTSHHLDKDLIAAMARAGCVRISIGLETLDPMARKSLPGLKQTEEERFDLVAQWCRDAGVELNCFVILGMPGGSVEGSKHTVERVRENGARVRPTIYTPFHLLRAEMDEQEVQAYNRQIFVDGVSPDEAADLYPLYFGKDPRLTRVMERIPKSPAAARQPAPEAEAGAQAGAGG
ncbi:B12-binding domain-containing radical SAM protein [Sorangium sp. So ce1151]|uniref:B12-binding domain-containing radical SAM protein n=1 Tax=Sorangium sp. So ce1151 TaxID=3133332 RepID=UPI003F5DFCA6